MFWAAIMWFGGQMDESIRRLVKDDLSVQAYAILSVILFTLTCINYSFWILASVLRDWVCQETIPSMARRWQRLALIKCVPWALGAYIAASQMRFFSHAQLSISPSIPDERNVLNSTLSMWSGCFGVLALAMAGFAVNCWYRSKAQFEEHVATAKPGDCDPMELWGQWVGKRILPLAQKANLLQGVTPGTFFRRTTFLFGILATVALVAWAFLPSLQGVFGIFGSSISTFNILISTWIAATTSLWRPRVLERTIAMVLLGSAIVSGALFHQEARNMDLVEKSEFRQVATDGKPPRMVKRAWEGDLEIPQSEKSQQLVDVFDRWLEARYPAECQRVQTANFKSDPIKQSIPVTLVAAEGGGIRAAALAFSTLTVLGQTDPNIINSIFCASTVSGGSVGVGWYLGALRHQRLPNQVSIQQTRAILSHEFLSPTIANFLTSDVIIGSQPFPLPVAADRSRALMNEFDSAFRNQFAIKGNESDPLALPLSKFGPFDIDTFDPKDLLNKPLDPYEKDPILRSGFFWIANATNVATGSQILLTDLPLSTTRTGLETFRAQSQGAEISALTAMSCSSRFPLITSSAVLPVGNPDQGRPHLRVVDGGYAENTGIRSLLEVFRAIEHSAYAPFCRFFVLSVGNDIADGSGPERESAFGELASPVKAAGSVMMQSNGGWMKARNVHFMAAYYESAYQRYRREIKSEKRYNYRKEIFLKDRSLLDPTAYADAVKVLSSEYQNYESAPKFTRVEWVSGEREVPLGWTLAPDTVDDLIVQTYGGDIKKDEMGSDVDLKHLAGGGEAYRLQLEINALTRQRLQDFVKDPDGLLLETRKTERDHEAAVKKRDALRRTAG